MKFYVRMGNVPNEIELLEKYNEYYDGIVFPVNIVAYFFNAIKYSVLTHQKPFFIDPITVLFQVNPDLIKREVINENNVTSLEFKKSFQKYFEYLGETGNLILKSKITPNILNETNIDSFIHDILEYQKEIFKEHDSRTESLEAYLNYLEDIPKQKYNFTPDFLVAPYFYFYSIEDPWYKINRMIAERIANFKQEIPIYGVICLDKELLNDPRSLEKISADFTNYDGYLFFINNFDEYIETEEILKKFIDFICILKRSKKPVINLYGSYLSQLAHHFGLGGFSTGVGILEKKDIFSPPISDYGTHISYYFPALHTRISENQFKSFIGHRSITAECSCPICQNMEKEICKDKDRIVGVDTLFYKLKKMNTNKFYPHYLLSKKKENEFIEKTPLPDLIASLIKEQKESEEFETIPPTKKTHLQKWINVLSSRMKK